MIAFNKVKAARIILCVLIWVWHAFNRVNMVCTIITFAESNFFSLKQLMSMVKVLKCRTLFSFCSQIECWFSRLQFTNACQNSKQGIPWSDCFWWSSLIWVCHCLSRLFGRQLVFKIFRTFTVRVFDEFNHLFIYLFSLVRFFTSLKKTSWFYHNFCFLFL